MTGGDHRFIAERLASAETALAETARELRLLGDNLHYEGERRIAKGEDDLVARTSSTAHDRARDVEMQIGNLARLRRWIVSCVDEDGTDPGIKAPEDPSA